MSKPHLDSPKQIKVPNRSPGGIDYETTETDRPVDKSRPSGGGKAGPPAVSKRELADDIDRHRAGELNEKFFRAFMRDTKRKP